MTEADTSNPKANMTLVKVSNLFNPPFLPGKSIDN